MTGFDIAVLGVVALSALLGLWRGVIREVFALAAWVAAVVGMFLLGGRIAEMLPFAQDSPWLRSLAGYALAFVGIFVALSLVGFVLSKLMKAVGLSFVDRALGMLFGVLRGGLIVVLLVFVAGATGLPAMSWWRESVTAKPLATFAAILRSKLPEDLGKRFRFSAPANAVNATSAASERMQSCAV
ncbi:MAG: CvpA family protein [Burkholderiales bacterium]|nr:CvpA family protein [Burkholderiales bacterium]